MARKITIVVPLFRCNPAPVMVGAVYVSDSVKNIQSLMRSLKGTYAKAQTPSQAFADGDECEVQAVREFKFNHPELLRRR